MTVRSTRVKAVLGSVGLLVAAASAAAAAPASAATQGDMSHPTVDATSPDNTTPVTRDITNACAVVTVEVPGLSV
jgi:hypothetical protein